MMRPLQHFRIVARKGFDCDTKRNTEFNSHASAKIFDTMGKVDYKLGLTQ